MTTKIHVLLALLALGPIAAAAADAPSGPITLEAKNGNVTFNHKSTTHVKGPCTNCHAAAAGGKIEGFGKEKAHALCIECHKSQGAGPTKCADCHKKA